MGAISLYFQQINQLVTKKARIVVLGRPSAFLSDSEYKWILRGTRQIGASEIVMKGVPIYREILLSDFDADEASKFLKYFLTYSEVQLAEREDRKPDLQFVKTRLLELERPEFANLIARPVHAKMLADLALNRDLELSKFSEFTLYDEFITQTIQRETTKPQRSRYGDKDRRKFARGLAWWLWISGSTLGLAVEDVPDKLIGEFRRLDDELDSVRRDLVSSCFLEKKLGDRLYFPHRSFQEFLIAERLLLRRNFSIGNHAGQ